MCLVLMSQTICLLFFVCPFLIMQIFCLISLASPASKPISMQECEAKSCGSLSNISYPFWIANQHKSFCGYPSLAIDCQYGVPFLIHVYGIVLKISNISYENKSIFLYNPVFHKSCPKLNTTFGTKLLKFSSTTKQIYMLSNCSKPLPTLLPTGYFNMNCSSNNDTVGYLERYEDELKEPNTAFASSQCDTVIVPVSDKKDRKNFTVIAHSFFPGFSMQWSYCKGCGERSGGCPTDYLADNSTCVCPNKQHFINCSLAKNGMAPAQRTGKNHKTIILGAVAGGSLFVAITTICIIIYKCKHKNRKQQASPALMHQSGSSTDSSLEYDAKLAYSKSNLGTPIFTYQELEEATDGFNGSNVLGEGGFGTVYKGNLQDGRIVAIKRLYENNYKHVEQFRNEVEILSNLKHQNLACLYGCTSRHSRELLLVYEFVPNGTVADHLHGYRASEGSLSWCIRMNIAIETADALQYLHAVKPQIIHRDVKTNNILLDSSFHVKVADFGLSRLVPLNATHVSTAPQGTPGYVDPEYYQCYQLTDKSDVFSFGVVLMELISSKPAVDVERPRQEINLSTMATNKILNNELDQFVDPTLGYNSDSEIKMMIDMVAEVACMCLQVERDMRPSIKEVLHALRAIQTGKTVAEFDRREYADALRGNRLCSTNRFSEKWESLGSTPNTSG